MDSPEPAHKFAALEAELAAKTSRVAELEAMVSLLEAENARLRRAVAKGDGAPGPRGQVLGRLVDGTAGQKRAAAEKLAVDGACDVIVLSDDEERKGIDVDATKGTINLEVTTRNHAHAVRVVTAAVAGGSESSEGEARSDGNLLLEDDDVLVTPRGKKRARVVTSDSEDEDANGGGLGCSSAGADGQEMGPSPGTKPALRRIIDSEEEDGNEGVHRTDSQCAPEMESEDEDDNIPICQVFKKTRKERVSDDDDEFSDAKGCSTPASRRSARLAKNQSKRGQSARRVLRFLEPKEYEKSDDDTEEDDDMDGFINDGDSSEHASGSADRSGAETQVSDASVPDEESSPESDGEINYADVMASIGRKRKTQDWNFEAEMLAAFDEHPELCMKAVCALYRRQTQEEQREKATFVHNKEGFSQIDASRASCIAEFLLDGDLYGPLKKTVRDLEGYDRYALEFCRKVASRYSKQLFAIYQNNEDPYFHL